MIILVNKKNRNVLLHIVMVIFIITAKTLPGDGHTIPGV